MTDREPTRRTIAMLMTEVWVPERSDPLLVTSDDDEAITAASSDPDGTVVQTSWWVRYAEGDHR